jgi:hypothetical protein
MRSPILLQRRGPAVDGRARIEEVMACANSRIKRGMLATTEKVNVRVDRGGQVGK